MTEIQSIVRRLVSASPEEVFALATLVRVQGSSYRRAGARMLLSRDGSCVGSISGGCLEDDVVERARRVLAAGVAEAVTYDTTSENDLVWGVGLGCHGIVDVLIERVPARAEWALTLARNIGERTDTALVVTWRAADAARLGTRLAAPAASSPSNLRDDERMAVFEETIFPPTPLIVIGAGDDAQPLCRLATLLGFAVTLVDHRAAYATTARFPEAVAVYAGSVEAIAPRLPLDVRACAVVMTHHYLHDLPWLRVLLPRPLAYLGLLGPKKRAEKILADIEATAPVTADARARLHAPVGLDVGARTPEEVALAIVSEILAHLRGRDARPLRERQRPIHDET